MSHCPFVSWSLTSSSLIPFVGAVAVAVDDGIVDGGVVQRLRAAGVAGIHAGGHFGVGEGVGSRGPCGGSA